MKPLLKTVLFLLLIGLTTAPSLSAATIYWIGTNSDPLGGTTWLATSPVSGDVAIINNGTTASLSTPFAPELANLWVSYAGGNGGLNMSGTGSVNMTGSYVVGAYGATGTHTMSGGNLTSGGYLYLGHSQKSVGIYNQSGGTATYGNTLRVGYANGSSGYLTISDGTINSDLNMAIAYSGGKGKVTQTGGTINVAGIYYVGYAGIIGTNFQSGGTVNTLANVSIGGGTSSAAASSYGYYKLTNGAINAWASSGYDGDNAFYVGHYSNGLFEQSGGTIVDATRLFIGGNMEVDSNGDYIYAPNGYGVYNMTGGTAYFSKSGGNDEIGGYGGTGTLNLSGGQITIGGSGSLYVGWNTNATGNVNLGAVDPTGGTGGGGGTLTANALVKHTASGITSTVNFHGGTLQARSNTSNFLNATTNYVYNEGAKIDTNSHYITVASVLAAPVGDGVAAPTVDVAGAGYVSPPIVKISGGGGTGATAIAVLKPDGSLDKIVITNPGVNYTSAPTFTLVGGDPTLAASVTASANVATVSGGLTKLGAGGLTLSATNTYTGPTLVNEGQLTITGSIASSSSITVANGAILSGSVSATTQPATTVNSGGILAPGSGTTAGTLALGNLTVGNNAILAPIVTATTNSLLQVNGNIVAGGGTSNLIVDLSTTPTALTPWTVLNYTGSMTGTVNIRPAVDSLGTVAVTTAWSGNNLNASFTDLSLGNQWNVAGGGNYSDTTKWSGASAPDGTSVQALLGSTGDGAINLDAGIVGNLDVSSMIFNSATAYTLSTDAAKKLNLQSSIAADAQITVAQGSHAINVDIMAASTNPRFNVNSGTSVLTVNGKVSGSANLNKYGAGTLVLANTGNDYTGATIMNGGTLEIASLADGGIVSSIGQSSAAPENLVLNGTLRYTGSSAAVNRGLTMRGYSATATQTSTIETANNLTFSGQIKSVGLTNLTKTGAGTLTFTNSGTDNILSNGNVSVSAGKLILDGGAGSFYNMRPGTSAQAATLSIGNTSGTAEMQINSGTLFVEGPANIGTSTSNATSKLLVNNAKLEAYSISVGTAASATPRPTMEITGTAQVISNGAVTIGSGANSISSLTQTGGSLTMRGNLTLGSAASSVGAVVQSGGSVTVGGQTYVGFVAATPATASYGYYQLSNDATFTTVSEGSTFRVGYAGKGLVEQSGNSTLDVADIFWVGGNYSTSPTNQPNAFGVFNLTGGTVISRNRNNTKSGIGGGGGGGVMNVSGTGQFQCLSTASDDMFAMGGYSAADRAILNLGAVGSGGGTFASSTAVRQFTVGAISTSLVNFHGGTLQALPVGTGNPVGAADFLAGDTVYIYSEGAKIDTNGTNITITNVLQPPSGDGLANITVGGGGGAGYISPPVVEITGGSGVGATANAVVSGGQVTGFVITNPGSGYTSSDVLTVNLSGGGGTGATGIIDSSSFALNATSGGLTKQGAGTLTLTGWNTYTGTTTISGGALAADDGTGVPAASFVSLDGGVLETYSFTRSLGTGFQWTANGGGFSANVWMNSVNINNDFSTLTWGTNVGTHIVGPLKFGSKTSIGFTYFQNGVDLNGANRTIDVDDNPATSNDYAVMTGAIINSTGTAGFTKTGDGVLVLAPPATNSYNGDTVISGGALQANDGEGLPNASFLKLDGGVLQSDTGSGVTFTRSLAAGGGNKLLWTANGGGFSAGIGTMNVRIGGTTAAVNWGNAPADIGSKIVGTLKFGSATAYNVTTFENGLNLNGALRVIQVNDNAASTADYADLTGVIANGSAAGGIVKSGAGMLRLSNVANTYTGATIMNGGTLEVVKFADAGVASSIGAASAAAANLVIDGTLKYIGIADVTSNRGFMTRGAYATFNTGDSGTNLTFSGPIDSEAVYFAKDGPGRLTFTNTGTNALTRSQTDVNSGVLIFNGGASSVYEIGQFNIANQALDTSAAVYQLSGTLQDMVNTTGGLFMGGTAAANTNAYAYYKLAGGTLNMGLSYLYVGNYGIGVFEQSAGSYNTAQQIYLAVQAGATGIYNLSGGTYNQSATYSLNIGWRGYGVANISGTAKMYGLEAVGLGNYAGGTGILNLGALGSGGGLISMAALSNTTGGAGLLNFHGGTLQARKSTTAFLPNNVNRRVLVYGEGATFDTNGFDITVDAVLETPAAAGTRGVSAIALSDGGSGYIGAPAVKITGGSGTGATAIANVDLDPASPNFGKVTGFTVTNPGTGYLPSDSLSVTLSGGGSTYPAYAGTISLNSGNVSGGLTKVGAGTLTLAATNTFTGPVLVQNGALSVGVINDGIDGPLGNSVLPVILGHSSGSTGTLLYTGASANATKKFTLATGGAGAIQVDSATANLTLSEPITGSGNFAKTGAGALTLATVESYTGVTTISAGTLALSSSGQITASSNIVNNATFQILDGVHTIGPITGTGTTAVNGTASLTTTRIMQGVLSIGGSGAAAVPEPSTMVLLALAGLAVVGAYSRRK